MSAGTELERADATDTKVLTKVSYMSDAATDFLTVEQMFDGPPHSIADGWELARVWDVYRRPDGSRYTVDRFHAFADDSSLRAIA